MQLSAGEIVGIATFILGGLGGLLYRFESTISNANRDFDKRLDKLESELTLISYRLGELEKASNERDDRIERAVSNITKFLTNQAQFHPRSFRGDGSPWPTDDTPTTGYPR